VGDRDDQARAGLRQYGADHRHAAAWGYDIAIYSVAGEILRVDQEPERLLARSGMPYRDATKDLEPGKDFAPEKPFGEG
jgi:hypothetical protein